jgi:hypothetical protein
MGNAARSSRIDQGAADVPISVTAAGVQACLEIAEPNWNIA